MRGSNILGGVSRRLAVWLWLRRVWWVVFLPLLSNTAAGANLCPNMQPAPSLALLIGISNPPLQEGPKPLRFAGADVASLQPLFEPQFGKANVFTLTGRDATTANVSVCLDALALKAQPGGKVVIFISARGFASSQTDDGFVITYDAAIDKVPRTGAQQVRNGIAIQTLRQKLEKMQARDKYLFLDLCRDPAETPNIDNLINKKVIDKKFLDNATSLIVLGSTGNQRSLESTDPKNGHGYYAGALSEILKPGIGLQTLFDELKPIVTKESRNKQVPYSPPPPPKTRQECVICKLSQIWKHGPLLASLDPLSIFQDAAPAGPDPDLQTLDDAGKGEADGQRIFIRYGQGKHFSGDPFNQCDNQRPEFRSFRLCREEYEAAAKSFEQAATLRERLSKPPDDNRMAIESLRERARFCRAQILLLAKDWSGAVTELGHPADFQFAESHNTLGIADLEQAKYPEAEAEFQVAIEQAPHWGYPRHNLALAYVEHGNYSAAESEYREAIRWTPVAVKMTTAKNDPCFHGRRLTVSARPYLYYNFGVLLDRLNRLAEAQQQYCLAEESFSVELGLTAPAGPASDAGDAQLAELRAMAAKINLADTYNSLGVLLQTRNKMSEARAQFEGALSNNPELSAAGFNLARLDAMQALAKGDTATARMRYQQVLDMPYCRGSADELACRAARSELERLH